MVGLALLNCWPYTSIPWWYASGYNHKNDLCVRLWCNSCLTVAV
jgi:hypothetical protein